MPGLREGGDSVTLPQPLPIFDREGGTKIQNS